jgi:tetratricopeptide (TPR) repeat protein
MSRKIQLLVSVSLCLCGEKSFAQDDELKLATAILEGAEAALKKEKSKALERLQTAALMRTEHPGLQETLGAAALLLGDRALARRVLDRTPEMAAYLAMAELDGPGGYGRASTALSRHVTKQGDKATAGALFLAALAFSRSGQPDKANELLDKAAKRATSAVDEAFAPDPAVGMVRSAISAVERIESASQLAKEARVRLATALFEADRRGEAVRIAESSLDDPVTRSAALRILVLAENASEARRALERVENVLGEEPDAQDAKVAKVVLLVRLNELDRAEKAHDGIAGLESKELRGELARARTVIALHRGKDPLTALDLAESAVRTDPKSDEAVALLVRALLLAKKVDRAEAYAAALLKRQPKSVDPFALLADVAEAKGSAKKAEELRLRSRGFAAEKAKLERAVEAREEVLRAVRDAEAGIGAVGLEALRGEYPSLSLPIDLALARGATPGFARAARDRILAACSHQLEEFLGHRSGWDRTTIAVALYGKVENLDAPLSAADPARCQVQNVRRR